MKSITDLVQESYEIAREHGFWDDPYNIGDEISGDIENPLSIPTKLFLIVSELVEAGEYHHKTDLAVSTNREHFIEELADVCIRLFDLCGYVASNYGGFDDLEASILSKMEVNRGRAHKHGKNY